MRAGNATIPRLPYLRRLDKIGLFEAMSAQDAVEALVGLGWPITPYGRDMEFWRLEDLIWSDDELIETASRQGVPPAQKVEQQIMAKDPPQTIGDMRRKAIVTDAEITAAVEAYLANPKVPRFQFASGHILDVSAAVEANRHAKTILAQKGTNGVFRRTMVRTAVILATPVAR
ncbi:hypothetical protein [Methylobacterium sp. SD21]|uniref:hypothetical protein n=1 Tax=Methylobacterium litchii TaxID=3138810 RepID=UPI00313C5117